jgi:hypothetical protein
VPDLPRPACADVEAKELTRPIDPSGGPVTATGNRRCDARAQPGGVEQRYGGHKGHEQDEGEG